MASSAFVDLGTVSVSGTTTGSAVVLEPHMTNFVGYLDVSALGAGTTCTVTIQHSPDGTNWFTLGAFTGAAATGKQIIQITANVLGHVRTTSTCAAGTTTATISCKLYYQG
jgi:hypothetical protein